MAVTTQQNLWDNNGQWLQYGCCISYLCGRAISEVYNANEQEEISELSKGEEKEDE